MEAMRGDVWAFPTLAGKVFKDERTEQPTQKPEYLITEIIKAYCSKSDTGFYEVRILDSFHGSGIFWGTVKNLILNVIKSNGLE